MVPNFLFTLAEGGAEPITLFPDAPTMIWTTINFVIIAVGLYYLLFKPLLGAISKREADIQADIQKAQEDRAEAERLRKDFESQIANAQAAAQDVIRKATQAATATKEQIESDARARATEMLENATKTIEREKQKAVAELREEVANLAVAVAGKVIERNLDNAEQQRLAESFVAEVGKN
ncbi:MAG: F0F1 ATP synthase subunit B [Mycobacterium leprae]